MSYKEDLEEIYKFLEGRLASSVSNKSIDYLRIKEMIRDRKLSINKNNSLLKNGYIPKDIYILKRIEDLLEAKLIDHEERNYLVNIYNEYRFLQTNVSRICRSDPYCIELGATLRYNHDTIVILENTLSRIAELEEMLNVYNLLNIDRFKYVEETVKTFGYRK